MLSSLFTQDYKKDESIINPNSYEYNQKFIYIGLIEIFLKGIVNHKMYFFSTLITLHFPRCCFLNN